MVLLYFLVAVATVSLEYWYWEGLFVWVPDLVDALSLHVLASIDNKTRSLVCHIMNVTSVLGTPVQTNECIKQVSPIIKVFGIFFQYLCLI